MPQYREPSRHLRRETSQREFEGQGRWCGNAVID
jgi:hypothetical protein